MSGSSSTTSSFRWWSTLQDECPITLEPLSTLPYPPFRLGGDASAMYFDGLALASYCVSRATFFNPLTREELTWEDCVRLDEYLDEYCYHSSSTGSDGVGIGSSALAGGRPGKISVREAYGLRSVVKVSTAGGGGHSRIVGAGTAASSSSTASSAAAPSSISAAQEEANFRRAEALRSEAAAALRGLFIFGNDRINSNLASPAATFSDALVVGPGARSGEMVPSAGFALHRLREGRSIGNHNSGNTANNTDGQRQGYDINGDVVLNEVEGLRIIDDDAAVAFGSNEAAWREVQEAFPTIDGMANGEGASALIHDDIAERPERSALLHRAKEVAAQTKRQGLQKQQNEERGRQMLIEDALKRRAERLRRRQEMAAKQAAKREAEKAEDDEINLARAEIERWREEQFDMLNRMAEETRRMGREAQEEKKRAEAKLQHGDKNSKLGNGKSKEEDADKVAAEAAAVERAAKKKAAKRKKERERQKAKKAAEKKERNRLAKIEEEKKRRAEAKLNCAHCSLGILDEGFEKMGSLFCSTKCARAGANK